MPSMPSAPPIVKPVLSDDAFRSWKRKLAAELFDIEPAPTWDAPTYVPAPIDEAFWAGFALGRAGEHPAPPEHLGEPERSHFARGWLAGSSATWAAVPDMSDAEWDALARSRAETDYPSSAVYDPESCGCC